MYRDQFLYYVKNQYRLEKITIDSSDVFLLHDLELSFHQSPSASYVLVRGEIPYLLAKRISAVNPTFERFFDLSHPSSGGIEAWVTSRAFCQYLIENLLKKDFEQISASEMVQQINQTKETMLREHPEDFYLFWCKIPTIDGLVTFLKEATAFYSEKQPQ